MIWEQLNPSLILPHMKAADYEDVMRQVGSTLIREGYAKDTYVQALIDRECDYPTGLDVDG